MPGMTGRLQGGLGDLAARLVGNQGMKLYMGYDGDLFIPSFPTKGQPVMGYWIPPKKIFWIGMGVYGHKVGPKKTVTSEVKNTPIRRAIYFIPNTS